MKKKTIYLIQEKGCLNPHSGAFQHISMGVKYLSKAFDLEIYLTTEKIKLKDYAQVKKSEYVHKQNTEIKGWGYGTLKDISILFLNGLKIPKLYKLFKTKKIDFVYERTSYLDFSGLIAARLAGIKHVYEANGLQYISRKKYYNSFFTPIIKRLEKTSYAQSDFNFFIGTYGDFWQIKKQNWLNIENGIEKELLSEELPNKNLSQKLQICFIGRPMKHHGLQILIDLLKIEEIKKNTTLHFIGEGFDNIENDLKALEVDVINHGFKCRDEFTEFSKILNLGLILKTPEYASNMKIFDYAALNCAVLSIDSYNMKYWFQDDFIFHDGSINSLKNKLEELIQNPEIMTTKSAILRKKITEKHTWDKVFEMEATVIKKIFQ